MRNAIIILSILLFVNLSAQDNPNNQEKIKNLEERVGHLASWVSELIQTVDSLKENQKSLEMEFARYKWNLVKVGMSWTDVISILGPPDTKEPGKFGTEKYIYGKGYVGFVLFDKEKKVMISNPPMELRMP